MDHIKLKAVNKHECEISHYHKCNDFLIY